MTTFQTIVDKARIDLQDSGKTRYTDSELLGFANDGLQEMYRYRPDLKFGNYANADVVYALNANVPLSAQYEMLLPLYICYRAELRDDEYSLNGRAAGFIMRFEKELKS